MTSVGEEFELTVAKLYERLGHDVEVHKIIKGKSGAEHEVDIYTTKRSLLRQKATLVECKYRDSREYVGKPEIANFVMFMDDIGIKEGHIVTNSYFSEQASLLGRNYSIRMIDGDELLPMFRKYGIRFNPNYTNASGSKSNGPVGAFIDFLCEVGVAKGILKRKETSRSTSSNQYNRNDGNGSGNSYIRKYGRNDDEDESDISRLFEIEKPNIFFDRDIGGLEEIKEQIKLAAIYPITRRDLYLAYDLPPSSVLLYGPPGCGKTLIAKAVATETQGDFIAPKINQIMQKWVGESEQFVSSMFAYARNTSQNAILFLDELDSIMPRSGPSYVRRIKDQFLTEMDGISKGGKISILGSTNKPWLVDTAIRRPGRFDKLMFVPPPSLEERKQILRVHMRNLIFNGKIENNSYNSIESLASLTEGWSGSDLEALINDAKQIAVNKEIKGSKQQKVSEEDFGLALSKRQPSVNPWFVEATRACRRYGEEELLNEIMKYAPRVLN